jgi:transposase-like protein
MEKAKMFEGVSVFDFSNHFTSNEDCKDYLSEMKWSSGYKCKKCSHVKYCGTNRYGERRCTKCRSVESPTAHTLFHKVKFPLLKAFHIIFYLSTSSKGMSTYEMARKLGMSQPVVWRFKRKVMLGMKSSGNYPIDGAVQVDETTIGGKVKEKRGRSQTTKKQVVIAIQKHPRGGISRAYARVIQNAGTKQLLPFIEQHIDKNADIITDGWRGYTPIAQGSTFRLSQIKSERGKNFPLLHRFIMGLKSWLRGIHHRVKYLQPYLDEYTYRFNRHLFKDILFHNLVKRLVAHSPCHIHNLNLAA